MTSYPPATSQEFCQNITTHLARPAPPYPHNNHHPTQQYIKTPTVYSPTSNTNKEFRISTNLTNSNKQLIR